MGGDGGAGGEGGVVDPEPLVVRVEIAPDQLTLVELDHATLVATPFDAADQAVPSLPVGWRSSNPAIASISGFGIVTANAPGTVTITASIEGVDAQAAITVTPGVVAGVLIDGMPSRIIVGDSFYFGALVVDSMGRVLPGRTATWSSSDPAVAAIDASGLVTAFSVGTTTITAEVEGVQGQAMVEVSSPVTNRVVMGASHTCYLDDAGAAWCWGYGDDGQLGDGFYSDRDVPTAVASGHTFVSLSAGLFTTCGVTDQNELWCWGGDYSLQLGGNGDSPVPVLVDQGPFAFTASMFESTCAIDLQGAPWCWGYNSSDFELGNSTTADSPTPMAVLPPAGGTPLELVELMGGVYHACGLAVDSRLYCWGWNSFGQLGVGNFNKIAGPVEVFPGQTVEAFGVGDLVACATVAGTSYCWGGGYAGQLGIGGFPVEVNVPTAVQSNGIAFVDFAGGEEHTCARDPAGQAWCWGSNDYGQLGRPGPGSDVPVPVSGGITFDSISARAYQTCGVADSGSIYCWGNNEVGQLGVGLPDFDIDTPTEVQW